MNKLIALTFLVMAGCTPGSDHTHQEDSPGQDSTNVLLYNQVMDIHDEVMPRMEDLYNKKKDIEEKLKDPAGLTAAQKEKLTRQVAQIDSVSKLMMDWMHEFNPPADSADKEETRAYLEKEMERIRIVKQAMVETIEEDGGAN
jgi:hypothetical protein